MKQKLYNKTPCELQTKFIINFFLFFESLEEKVTCKITFNSLRYITDREDISIWLMMIEKRVYIQ